jgi:ATP-dependent helicase/nuclease subunit A
VSDWPGREVADALSRAQILGELDVTMLVEAAAGTGKTTSLVGRMVNLIRSGRAGVATIAAITFTVKAAANLREAFQQALEAAVQAESPDIERERLQKALGEIDRGFIGTTHAFCARLLRERPVEAGLDPEFRELDAPAAFQLSADFWNDWHERESSRGNHLIVEAGEADLDRTTLRSAFLRLVDHPDVVFVAKRKERPDLRLLCERLSGLLDDCLPHLPDETHRESPDKFETLMVHLLRRRESTDLGDLKAQLAFLEEANHASNKPTQRQWPDKATAKRLGETYNGFIVNTLRPALQQWREYVHAIVIELLAPALREFARQRREQGTLTFQDLLLCARDMLGEHSAVRRYFQRRFTHLLVDEFQDTDPLQAEVLLFLTAADTSEKNWRRVMPLPGSLFIVGDPKQSIYRFRRADITTYLDVRERIEASGGKVVPLSTNFRSAPAICTFVNEAFDTLFPAAEVQAGYQAEHVELHPWRDPGNPVGVYHLETAAGTNDSMADAEAECIASWIRRAIDSGMEIDDGGTLRPLRYRDVLMVSWQRPRLARYSAALGQRGIPCEITGSKAFGEAEALREVMPLLHALVEPDDAVSVLAFLRGPLCGVDDDALYRFVSNGGRFSPFATPPADTDSRIARGLDLLKQAVNEAANHPPAAVLQRLFERLGLLASAALGERGGTRSGNLLLALSIAREESAGGASLASIVETLEELLEANPDIEELDVDPSRSDAVRLMNLHQVKGLEAPVVFLIDPADEFDFPIDLYVDRSGGESRAHVLVTKKYGKGLKDVGIPSGWDGYKVTESAFKSAEKKRLLYVAATRARNILVVGFRQGKGGVAGAWRELAGRVRERLFAPGDGSPASVHSSAVRQQFAEAMSGIESRFEEARLTSYSVLPITKIAHPDHISLVRAEEGLGKGTSWGRVLHRLFEAVLRDPLLDVALFAGNLLKDEERDPVDLPEVLAVMSAVRDSALWQRVLAAPERYVEIPFALSVKRREVGLDEDGDTLLHGTIDLVFREGERWYVVDYKSDSTKGRLEHLVDYYRLQVEHYARFWSQLTGAPATGGLFFVDGCIEKWVTA